MSSPIPLLDLSSLFECVHVQLMSRTPLVLVCIERFAARCRVRYYR